MHTDARMRWMRKRVLYHLHTTPIPVDGGDQARVTGLLSYFKDRRSSLAIDAFSSATCLGWTVARRARVPEYWRPNIAAFVLESAEHLFIRESKWDLVECLYAQAARRYYRRFRREILPTDSQIAVSRSYASFVQRPAAQQRYDYIWINFIEYARLCLTVLPTQTQRVIDIHDLASVAKHSKQDLPESRGLTFDFARNLAAEMKVLVLDLHEPPKLGGLRQLALSENLRVRLEETDHWVFGAAARTNTGCRRPNSHREVVS
jgi:hypothetical protein